MMLQFSSGEVRTSPISELWVPAQLSSSQFFSYLLSVFLFLTLFHTHMQFFYVINSVFSCMFQRFKEIPLKGSLMSVHVHGVAPLLWDDLVIYLWMYSLLATLFGKSLSLCCCLFFFFPCVTHYLYFLLFHHLYIFKHIVIII